MTALMRSGVDTVSVSQMTHALTVSTTPAFKVFSLTEHECSGQMALRRSPESRAGR